MIVPKGDYGYYLNFTVQDSGGVAYPLTDYTAVGAIKLKCWVPGVPGTLVLSGTCVIVVAASGTCRYLVIATDFIVTGIYSAELELTKTGVIESTAPFTIEVKESA